MIRIVTDSTCDLPPSVVDDLNITVLPYYIHVGLEEYLDGIDMSREMFYQQLPFFKAHPTTAAPSTESFRQAYEQLAEAGATEILSIHISRTLSAAVDFASIAAQETTTVPVTVFDSGQLSLGMGFMIKRAAAAADQGKRMADIVSQLEEQGSRTHLFAVIDTLTFMRRSGRMNSMVASIGSLLQIKPLLKMHQGVATSERLRTRKRAYKRLLELLEAASPVESVVLLHTHAPDQAQLLRQEAAHLLPDGDIPSVEVTPVLGTHLGPGAVGFTCVSTG